MISMASFFIVNCKHISNFVLIIIDFEQTNVWLVHIEKAIKVF